MYDCIMENYLVNRIFVVYAFILIYGILLGHTTAIRACVDNRTFYNKTTINVPIINREPEPQTDFGHIVTLNYYC